jgi:CMP-N,N'-diacetyllegionaminic acid synthase
MGLRRLAIIPARGGSKGLPGKNLAEINGYTLIGRAAACAAEAEVFDTIVVTTDYDQTKLGWLPFDAIYSPRPPELARDDTDITDVIKHVLGALGEQYDCLALLQPTSPTRTPEIVRECVLAVTSWSDAALTVSPVPPEYHPHRQFDVDELGHLKQAHPNGKTVSNRQSLHPTYIRNGLCYAVLVDSFLANGLLGFWPRPIFTEGRHVNIDTPEDLEEARRLLG